MNSEDKEKKLEPVSQYPRLGFRLAKVAQKAVTESESPKFDFVIYHSLEGDEASVIHSGTGIPLSYLAGELQIKERALKLTEGEELCIIFRQAVVE